MKPFIRKCVSLTCICSFSSKSNSLRGSAQGLNLKLRQKVTRKWSTLRIGPCLFYVEKCTTQFNTTEKKLISHRTRFKRKRRCTSTARSSRRVKVNIILNTRQSRLQLCAVQMRNVILGNDFKCVIRVRNTVCNFLPVLFGFH